MTRETAPSDIPAQGPSAIYYEPQSASLPQSWRERLREGFGRNAIGIVLALALEALLIIFLLLMSQVGSQDGQGEASITSFNVEDGAEEAEAPEAEEERQPADVPQVLQPPALPEEQPDPLPQQPPALAANPVSRPIITLSPEQFADTDISNLPRRRPDQPSGPAYGPAMPGSSSGDSQIVGTAPNGEPMYAARWYREPTREEMSGYLSTANPGSWALITCRTAPRWRVEDCIGLEQYPTGSNLLRAVLAATWQFEVRPPQRRGEYLTGSWVRIMIRYDRAGR